MLGAVLYDFFEHRDIQIQFHMMDKSRNRAVALASLGSRTLGNSKAFQLHLER
jgi:hypothetical protein